MNCKFAGYKGFGASPKRKSPARQVRRVRDFAGSVATLPMLAVFSFCPSVPRGSSHTCRRYRPKAPFRHRSCRFLGSAGPFPFTSWSCKMSEYSLRMSSKSSPCARISKKEIERCLYEVFRKYGDRFP